MEKNWHNLSFEEVIKTLKSDEKGGLTEREVRARQREFGRNELPREKPLPKLKILLGQFKSPLIYILVIVGAGALILREWTDAMVIFSAIFLNVTVGFFQENKASNILRELKKVLKSEAVVIREGIERKILKENLVPGDALVLRPGDKVSADARLIESFNLKVNEAPLTGEWLVADKKVDVLPKKTSLADRENMVYMGTTVQAGIGRAVVVSTGLKTEIGKVAELVGGLKEEMTPYQKKLADFSNVIVLLLIIICLLIFSEGMLIGREFREMFLVSAAVAIAAIPEGLPVAMTVILALGMRRILVKKGLVRRLASVETLGSTSVIATDKTLTLTEGKMEVAEVLAEDKNLALKIAALCSESFIENPSTYFEGWRMGGGPTDKALVVGAAKEGLLKPVLEKEFPRLDKVPLDEKRKYIASLHKGQKNNFLYICGAPEKILELSKLAKKEKEAQVQDLEKLTSSGLRVIALAYKKLTKDKEKIETVENLEFAGLIGLKDPLRKEAKEAIAVCKKAGMKPIIVTGDHVLTAKAVAKELGLNVGSKNVILGQDLDELSDAGLDKKLTDLTIYARVEPKHKLRIIEAWQKKGEVVAMTGDGINDAPALKRAEVGVALGSGTEAAKEASDLILLTDNFSVIVEAVREGRAVLDNIRKVITYLVSDSFAEIVLVGVSILAKTPLPITAAQILWINLIEDGLPDIALAFEPEEKDLMERRPEKSSMPLLTREMKALIFIIGIFDDLLLLGLFFWLLRAGREMALIRTIIFAAHSIDTFYFVFSCKSLRKNVWHLDIFSNKFLILAVAFGFLMLTSAIYFPPFQKLLETVPLTIKDWSVIITLGFIDFCLIELTKHYFIVRKMI